MEYTRARYSRLEKSGAEAGNIVRNSKSSTQA